MISQTKKEQIDRLETRVELAYAFHQACRSDDINVINYMMNATYVAQSKTIQSQGFEIACETQNI